MNKLKILISDKISEKGIDIIRTLFQVDIKPGLTETELIDIIKNYDALIVRSETNVTSNIIHVANRLKIIGRAGVGVDNIDVGAATKKGIIVVNSPEGNTIAAAEHSFAMMLAITRNIPNAHNSIQKGEWNRGLFTGIELYGKTLGVVGLGKIGQRVSKYALGMGMNVIGYDPYINSGLSTKVGINTIKLDELLRNADIITFHIPLTNETTNLIDKKKFNIMKTGVFIVNCARGGIIVEKDLRDAVVNGKVSGAAVDVFSNEPIKKDNVLLGLDRIITTPHIGAATKEAKINVAIDVAEQVRDVLLGGVARSAVNTPN
ncbi:MAG: hypothetical protein A2Y40_06880 [Candidatus Margulisbacteria bacterium GWF2_35_9]|nr:MAG: hypothetical protein A2Y40_06880 [Candidatus Margulisbacteria bacterium GWF2_35_9]